MASDKTVIEAAGLVKRYGTFTAVNGVSFNVYEGEIFGLLGPNGAGKTTTMEMIEGLRKPDGGFARVAGFDTQKQLGQVKEVIGVQLQSTSLFDLLKVREIVQMYASFYTHTVPIEPLLADMLLQDKIDGRVKNLSGGQKQRLAIALALINDPKVVFLDEPTTGLDPQARRSLWDIIERLKQQGKTVVLSTHYMDEAHVLCDRICLMDRGEVIALDTPRNLVRSLQSDSAIEFRLPEPVVPEREGTAGQAQYAFGQRIVTAAERHGGDAERDALIGRKQTAEPQEGERRRDHTLELLRKVTAVKQAEQRGDTFVLYTDRLQETLTDLVRTATVHQLQLTDLQTRTATLEDVFIHMTGRSLREA